jgi:hypothetical protein
MNSSDQQCSKCGAALPGAPSFCQECGAYLLTHRGASALPPSIPVSKQNPLLMLEKMGGGESGKLGTDDLMAARFELAEQLEHSELYPAAEAEFERSLESRMRDGNASERFFKLWLTFWKKLDNAVSGIRQEISALRDNIESRPKAFDRLLALFDRDLNLLVREIEASGGDISKLLVFQMRVQQAWESLETLHMRVEALKIAENCAVLKKALIPYAYPENQEYAVAHLHLEFLDPKRGLSECKRVRDAIINRYENLSLNAIANRELAGRCSLMLARLEDLVDADSELYLKDGAAWFKAISRGWIANKPDLVANIASMNRSGLQDFISETTAEMNAAAQQTINVMNIFNEELAAKREDDDRDKQRQAEAADQSKLINDLIRQQQIHRQWSEGKFGSALMTDMFGSQVGAIVEGFQKK